MTHAEAVNSLATERYLLDEMTGSERDAFEAHFFECRECGDDVKAGSRMRDGARAGLLENTPEVGPKPATPPGESTIAAPPWHRSPALAWGVAASLAVLVGYQSLRPSSDTGAAQPAALTAVLLRPASRGAVPTVSLAGTHAALAIDVDAAGATELSYELRGAGSSTIASGRVPAPGAGLPLLLVIPTFTLKPGQQYILTVHDRGPEGRTIGEYRFTTTP